VPDVVLAAAEPILETVTGIKEAAARLDGVLCDAVNSAPR